MKVSVLIPVYNVQEYLHSCIESVLNQSYQDFEIVLVDDGSTDSSGEICDIFSVRYPEQVKVLHTENQGALLSRSSAMKQASGEVLVFLDADDCLRADALSLICDAFAASNCDMVLYNVSAKSDFSQSYQQFPFQDHQFFEGETKRELYDLFVSSSGLNSMCNKAVRSEIASCIPDYTDLTFVKHGEDLLSTMPLITKAEKILYLDQNLYFYRQREGSTVHSFDPKRHESIKAVHQEMERYIDLWNMPELHVKHYTREVRGWIVNLKTVLSNRKTMDTQTFNSLLHQLANDQYFRSAYKKMNAHLLTNQEVTMAKWLYGLKYWRLVCTSYILQLRKK